MARKTCKPEDMVAKLRQVDVLRSEGIAMKNAIWQSGVSEITYYRWRLGSGPINWVKVSNDSLSPTRTLLAPRRAAGFRDIELGRMDIRPTVEAT